MRRKIVEHPSRRVMKWIDYEGWNITEAAKRMGIDRTMLSYIVNKRRVPGRKLANILEKHSAHWPDGPIKASEWD